MGVAAKFSKTQHNELTAHAAWFPVAITFALGDYGLVSDGVFHKLGNSEEFGVQFSAKETEPAQMGFKSERARRVNLVGGVEVNVLPSEPIDAQLKIEVETKDSS